MADDALLNKAASIERCLKRIQEEYAGAPLETSQTRQDALVLNLLRACETAIDMAMHLESVCIYLGIVLSGCAAEWMRLAWWSAAAAAAAPTFLPTPFAFAFATPDVRLGLLRLCAVVRGLVDKLGLRSRVCLRAWSV